MKPNIREIVRMALLQGAHAGMVASADNNLDARQRESLKNCIVGAQIAALEIAFDFEEGEE